MLLNKEKWTQKDINQYHNYVKKLKGEKINCQWEKRIVNTKLECFARTSTKAAILVNQIVKGNYISFLDNLVIQNHMDSLVSAKLLNKIKDFITWKKYLFKYVKTIDNWASCDTLKFNRFKYEDYYKVATKLISSKKEFIRRCGINIFFEIYKDEKYADIAFDIIDSFKTCNQYYVNMVCAWLLSFLYIKYPAKTLKYFKNNDTSKFIINKGISKCCDSYRVTKKDKEKLKKLRIN